MNSTQVYKEARQLFWPWSVITALSLVSLIHFSRSDFSVSRNLAELLVAAGAFLGLPLLATLPLGVEFQYRTFGLSLAQPMQRADTWRLKFLVSMAAILLPALIYAVGLWWRIGAGHTFWICVVVIAMVTSGTTYWTLYTRSTIGGLGLSTCVLGTLEIAWMYVGNRLQMFGHGDYISPAYLWATLPLGAVYAVFMVWLGRRRLLDFQAVEGMQADETVIPGARYVPQFLTDRFRSRSTGPVLNLIRREFHLLRLVWALGFLLLLDWIVIAGFRLLDEQHVAFPRGISQAQFPAIAIAMTLSMLIALLSGTLSLGEEKNWGTHEWHMTVPVSVPVQWLVKLLVALFTSVVAGVGPAGMMIVQGWLVGSPFKYAPAELVVIAPLEAALFTLIGFWCASVVKGTVRATLWVFPLCFTIGLMGTFGSWIFSLLGRGAASAVETLVWRLDPIAVNAMLVRVFNSRYEMQVLAALALTPGIVVAILQSYRLFRGQSDDTKLHMLRSALPLVVIALFFGFAAAAFGEFVQEAWKQQGTLLRETHLAIEVVQATNSNVDAAHPLRLTANELAKAAPMSDRTRAWLGDANIVVAPEQFGPPTPTRFRDGTQAPRSFSMFVGGPPGKTAVPYSAVIRMAKGTSCSMSFATSRYATMGVLGGVCD